MKICQITYSGFGGLGSVIFSLISADQRQNHQWPIGFIGNKPLDDSYQSLSKKMESEYKAFQFKPRMHISAWIQLFRWLQKLRPEVIICHTLNPILVCKIYCLFYSIPLISVAHTSNAVKPLGEKITSFFSILFSNKIILLTNEYKFQLQKSYGLFFPDNKVEVIPNGIDLKVFYPAIKKEINQAKYKIGMAGRFSLTKKQDLLIQALDHISILRPDLNIELHLAGDGEQLEILKLMAKGSINSKKIIFNGLLDEVDIAPWMRDLDIYVHATDGETLSTSLLQAMASSLPIIASDVTGVDNLIGLSKDFGFCVQNEAEYFAEKIIEVLLSMNPGYSPSNISREYVTNHFNHDLMLSRYIQAIEKTL